jgi:nucleotide-binding universal stress UspA family protein
MLFAVKGLGNVLVAIDGTDVSEGAVRFAVRLAKRAGASLSFCNAVDLPGIIAPVGQPYAFVDVAQLMDELEAGSKSILSAAAEAAKAAGVATATRELSGAAPRAILDEVPASHADAIVMGTHGYEGAARFFLGSTAESVLREASIPVFIVPAGAKPGAPADPLLRIAVAVDASDSAAAALELAVELAKADSARLSIVHSISHDDDKLLAGEKNFAAMSAGASRRDAAEAVLSAAAKRARDRGVEAETVLLESESAAGILDFVANHEVDLLAMGTHGRRGLHRLFLGSVAEGVVRHSSVPVVVVRQAEGDREDATSA